MSGFDDLRARVQTDIFAGLPSLPVMTKAELMAEFASLIFRSRLAAFGATRIPDTFATSEGLVGASAPDDPVITMATDSCLVELVDDAYRPVPPGVASAKVLVTNLYNTLQPLIRADLRAALLRTGLADPEVHVDAVSSLPRRPETGKLRRVIPA